LFGSTSAVYGFNRLARALWYLAVSGLGLLVTNFYDDYPGIEPALTSSSARASFEVMLTTLGWRYSDAPSKSIEFRPSFDALGVCFCLESLSKGTLTVSNKSARIEQLNLFLEEVLRRDHLSPAEAASLQGRLTFAESHIFGRAARPMIRTIGRRAHDTSGNRSLRQGLRASIQALLAFLKVATPRVLRKVDEIRPILMFTDGACEETSVTCGALIVDQATGSSEVFGGSVPADVVTAWRSSVGLQVIGQAELYPVVLARQLWSSRMAGRRAIIFIDNDAARGALIKAFSPSRASQALVALFYQIEQTHPSFIWFARVASYSNPADAPSRGQVRESAALFGAKEVPLPCLTPGQLDVVLSVRADESDFG